MDFKPSIIVTDMFKPFRNVINNILTLSKIVSDKYNVIRQGIQEIRDIRINLFNSDSIKNREFKKYWKVIQKNPKNLSKQEDIIAKLKSESNTFVVSYDLIKRFYSLFDLTEITSFTEGLEHLITDLKLTNITKCDTLSSTLNSWFKEIVNIIKYGYNNGFVEGFNNKIKVIVIGTTKDLKSS